jgi:hypothetical protein
MSVLATVESILMLLVLVSLQLKTGPRWCHPQQQLPALCTFLILPFAL